MAAEAHTPAAPPRRVSLVGQLMGHAEGQAGEEEDAAVFAHENEQLHGWSSDRPSFHVARFVEFWLYDVLYPLSTPLVLLTRGYSAAVNLHHIPDFSRRGCEPVYAFVLLLSLALTTQLAGILVWATHWRQGEAGPDAAVWVTLRYETAFLIFLLCFGKVLPNIPWAWMTDARFTLLTTTVVTNDVLYARDPGKWTAADPDEVRACLLIAARTMGQAAEHTDFRISKRQRALLTQCLAVKARACISTASEADAPLLVHAHAACRHKFAHLDRFSWGLSLAVGFMPMCVRVAFGLDPGGSTLQSRFVAGCSCFWASLSMLVIFMALKIGVVDFALRRHALEMLGSLTKRRFEDPALGEEEEEEEDVVVRRRESPAQAAAGSADDGTSGKREGVSHSAASSAKVVPAEGTPLSTAHTAAGPTLQATPDGQPPPVQPPILPLNSIDNVRAWLLARRILSRAGLIYNAASQALASVLFAFGFFLTLSVCTQLYTSPSTSLGRGETLGTLVASCFALLYLLSVGVFIFVMLLEAAAANLTVEAHKALLVGKQMEVTQEAALARERGSATLADTKDGAARLLAVVARMLDFEPPLRLFGVQANWSLISAVMSSITTAGVTVFGLLQARFNIVKPLG